MEKDLNTTAKQGEKMTSESATDSTTDKQVAKQENNVPQARVNEMVAKSKETITELEAKLRKYEEGEKARELEELEKAGETDRLIKQLKQTIEDQKVYVEEGKASAKRERESYLSQLPEDKREKYADHPIDFLQDAVELYNGANNTKPKVATQTAQRGDSVSPQTAKEVWEMDSEERGKNWSNIVKGFANKTIRKN